MVYDPSKTMDKRAFLVLGPESSGTRLMTKLLMVAGCYGDDGHVQRLDRDPLPNVPFEVVNYEALVSRPQAVTAQLMTRLGLPAPAEVSIYDGNAKYYVEVLA
jgi:LPS sulfotransferase NodH